MVCYAVVLDRMASHGVVWYGMVWYGMVWYGMVWYGMVWYGMVWYGMVWYGMVWYGMVWLLRYSIMVWYSMFVYIVTHGIEKYIYNTLKSEVQKHTQAFSSFAGSFRVIKPLINLQYSK